MKDLHLAEPNYRGMYESEAKENRLMKEEFNILVEKCNKMGLEDEQLRARIAELEKENLFLSGQIEAFKYCAKGGAE